MGPVLLEFAAPSPQGASIPHPTGDGGGGAWPKYSGESLGWCFMGGMFGSFRTPKPSLRCPLEGPQEVFLGVPLAAASRAQVRGGGM